MKNTILSPIMILAGLLGVTGCALDSGGPLDTGDPIGSAAGENVATAQQPLLGSAHAQAFGFDYGTPDFGNGQVFGYFEGFYPNATGDLDGDGTADLVVGIPMADDGTLINVGAIDILWGQHLAGSSFGGLSNSHVTQLHAPTPKVDSAFGKSVAIGDFNCDGYPDLAVGSPDATLPVQGGSGITWAGSVSILYGPNFASAQWQLFWQGSAGIPGVPEAADHFGAVLAVGNFNHDASGVHACDDLAIGTPDEDIGSAADAGSVTILYGRSTGLNTAGAPAPQLWDQNVGSLFGVAEARDHFGASLAVGDFNHDGKDDLAIGVPGESYENLGITNVGLVQVMNGTVSGLTDVGSHALQLNDLPGLSMQTADMGVSLAAGDFDGDGAEDLAVGADTITAWTTYHAGGVLMYRQVNGVLVASLRYGPGTGNMPGVQQDYAYCGSSLVAGDFNGDGHDDLASGCHGEIVTEYGYNEGAINVAQFGVSAGSLYVTAGQLWNRNSSGIPGQCTDSENFGYGLASGDFNGDGKSDLVAQTQPFRPNYSRMSINVFYGTP